MRVYRTNAVLSLNVWDETKASLEISPALEGNAKGQPQSGEKRYNYDKLIRITFTTFDMLLCANKLRQLSEGNPVEYTKFADLAKVEGSASTDKKSLKIAPLDKGGVGISLSRASDRVNIVVSQDDCYALSEWFRVRASKNIEAETRITKQDNTPED